MNNFASFCFLCLAFHSIFAKRRQFYYVSAKKRMNSFVLLSTFRNFAIKDGEIYSVSAKKELNSFDLLSTFRNFEPEYEGVTILRKIPQSISLG